MHQTYTDTYISLSLFHPPSNTHTNTNI